MNRELPQPEPELESDPWAEGNYGPFAGPLPPDLADLYVAQTAPTRPELTDAQYERLVAERCQTEAAYLDAHDRELARTLEAQEAEAEAEQELEL